MGPDDVEELEAHLIDEIEGLRERGLSESEAFIIATRRIGETHSLSREYFKVNVNRLWKSLAVPVETRGTTREWWITIMLAATAALLAQIPFLFGGSYFSEGREAWSTFSSLWILPSMAAWFLYRHGTRVRRLITVTALLGLIHLFVALFPFAEGSSTRVLVMIHIPFLSWILLLPLALDLSWRSVSGMVHYLRLSAEAFIYSALLGLGGITLLALTIAIFDSAGMTIESLLVEHFVIAGIFSIPVVGVVLADRKRQVIENFAPTLARFFVPLFTLSSGAFLTALAVFGIRPGNDRELLLALNILLLLVVAMLFYDVSAREESETRRISDWINIILLISAISLDGIALIAIASRLFLMGMSPNRVAVFGFNGILLLHLVVLLVVYGSYLLKRTRFRSIEAAVVRMVPIYAIWLFSVVVLFPVLFGGR